MARKEIEVEELSSIEEAKLKHERALKKYDFYLIRDLEQLKNRTNFRVCYCKKEKLFLIITGKSVLRQIVKKQGRIKVEDFIFGDKK